jgi:hypothetical protein
MPLLQTSMCSYIYTALYMKHEEEVIKGSVPPGDEMTL